MQRRACGPQGFTQDRPLRQAHFHLRSLCKLPHFTLPRRQTNRSKSVAGTRIVKQGPDAGKPRHALLALNHPPTHSVARRGVAGCNRTVAGHSHGHMARALTRQGRRRGCGGGALCSACAPRFLAPAVPSLLQLGFPPPPPRSAPLFLITWPLFSLDPTARLVAAVVCMRARVCACVRACV